MNWDYSKIRFLNVRKKVPRCSPYPKVGLHRPAATWLRGPAQRIIQNDTNIGQETMEDIESHSIETSHPGAFRIKLKTTPSWQHIAHKF